MPITGGFNDVNLVPGIDSHLMGATINTGAGHAKNGVQWTVGTF
jgi:hypothetical protein